MISIITPTYNRARLIGDTARSVLAQTCRDYEWVIADDGSEDNTEKIISAFGDNRIRYFKLPHNGHLPRVRNYAITASKGEYIAFLDSDDLWKKNMLEKMLKILEQDETIGFAIADTAIRQGDIVLHPSIYHSRYKKEKGSRFYTELFTDRLFVIFPSTLVMRRNCFEKTGMFDEKLRFGEKDFFTRLAWHYDAKISDQVLAVIRRHETNESLSEKRGSLAEESFMEELYTLDFFYNKGYISRQFHERMSAVYFFKLAEFYYRRKYFAEAKAAYRSSLACNPLNLKGSAKYFLSSIRSK